MQRTSTLAVGLLAGLLACTPAALATQAAAPGGAYCAPFAGGNGFRLLALKGESQQVIRFGFSMGTPEGSHCGVTGTATPSQAGWTHTSGSEAGADLCVLTLSRMGDGYRVSAAPGTCAGACGARATIDGVTFPAASKVQNAVSGRLFEPETLFNTDCSMLEQFAGE